jgi:hypothetical protein
MYGGRKANKESGKPTLETYINGIGKVKLVFHHELNSIKSYRMYSENEEYLGYARQHSDGSWRFDHYPAIVIHNTSNSPYAVNITGC